MNDEYLEKVSKQKIGYNELDKFVPGEAGLQYFPVPKEEHDKWRKDQDRKNMEAYEKREREKNNAVLEIREEEVRGNGHNEKIKIEIPIAKDGKEIGRKHIDVCKDCNMYVCDCQDNPKIDKIKDGTSERYPRLCDLKKSTRKRASSKKKK